MFTQHSLRCMFYSAAIGCSLMACGGGGDNMAATAISSNVVAQPSPAPVTGSPQASAQAAPEPVTAAERPSSSVGTVTPSHTTTPSQTATGETPGRLRCVFSYGGQLCAGTGF